MGNVISVASGYAQNLNNVVYGAVFASTDPFVLEATPENLKKVIQEKGAEVFNYKFEKKGWGKAFTPLEYSMMAKDKESFLWLLSNGAPFSVEHGLGTPAHFYLDYCGCRDASNLEMFRLVLDQMKNINEEEAGGFLTSLEYALSLHADWSFVEELLARGVIIEDVEGNGTTPFSIVKDADNFQHTPNGPVRTAEGERSYSERLMKYVELEKKYYPNSTSGLTADEFKFHTTHLRAEIAKILTAMVTLSDRMVMDFLIQAISESLGQKQEEMESLELLLKRLPADQGELCRKLYDALHLNRDFFVKLVKDGDFKDCYNLLLNDIFDSFMENASERFARESKL